MLRAAALLISLCPLAAIHLDAVGAPRAHASAAMTRRHLVQAGGAAVAALGLASSASAEEETFSRLGGLLEPFVDIQKGYKLYKPSGWTQYSIDPGVYDVKFADIIEPFESVIVSSSPVATATSISALGDLPTVGAKFAKSRNAELVKATERTADGNLVYTLELKGDVYHELLTLSINRGKLFRVTATATNKRWSKRSELYSNIMLSFVPSGV
mmetsp:Transcript_19014/g.49967  ORF Transcript_19014/g.49967 Transcript_19014/m.49967 type:complete len:213 (+) Transcript_19014:32-670(+)